MGVEGMFSYMTDGLGILVLHICMYYTGYNKILPFRVVRVARLASISEKTKKTSKDILK